MSGHQTVELALLTSRIEAAARAMMNTLLRTARSAVLSIARDFSCVVLTADDELLAAAESVPIHVFRGPELMAQSMRTLHPDFAPGDAFLHNSPYHGNSHSGDWCVIVPVFDGVGEHRFTVVAMAHLADTGNSIPSTGVTDARDLYEEGSLFFPCVRVQTDYRNVEDIIRICRLRIRVPDIWYGDFLAILGAARIGERRLVELIEDVGTERLEAYQRAWFDYSESLMAREIAKLPAGTTTVHTRHDPVAGFPDGVPVNVTVSVKPDEQRVEVDLRDNIDNQPFGLNLSEATALSAALIGVFSGLQRPVPPNHGSFRRVDVLLRENCIVGIPRHPASCSLATTNLSECVSTSVVLALAELGDGFGLAEAGRPLPASCADISGIDPRPGRGPFINLLMLAETHGPGAPRADGWLAYQGMGSSGVTSRDSVEIDELKYPILVHEESLVPDSEGAGRFRGAPAVRVEYGPIDGADIEVIWLCDGTHNAPRGARGGGSGGLMKTSVRQVTGEVEELPNYGRITLHGGESLISVCNGGGGYGPPLERDPQAVRHDVVEGWVSVDRARDVYGVCLDARLEIDLQATAGERARRQDPRP